MDRHTTKEKRDGAGRLLIKIPLPLIQVLVTSSEGLSNFITLNLNVFHTGQQMTGPDIPKSEGLVENFSYLKNLFDHTLFDLLRAYRNRPLDVVHIVGML